MGSRNDAARALEHAVAIGKLDKELVEELVEQIDRVSVKPVRFDWHRLGLAADFAVSAEEANDFVAQLLPSLEAGDRLEVLINGLPKFTEATVRVIRDVRTSETPGLEAGF